MISARRHPRYPVNLRLRLQLPTGELETTTDEVSLAGFSAPAPVLPEVGTSFGFVIHLPDGAHVTGTACAMRLGDGGSAGFSCEFPPGQQQLWENFVQQEQASGGLWRMIGRFAISTGDDAEAMRSVLVKGPLGILFRRIGGEKKAEAEASEPPAVMRLHMVGENCEAYRIAFEKHATEGPEVSVFANAAPNVLDFARQTIARVLTQGVFLKRSPHAVVEPVRLVEMTRGGFGYVVPQASGKVSLMGLHGSELIVIEVDGKRVFPFFESEELDRIACDTFRRVPGEPTVTPTVPVREERFSAQYQHKIVHDRVACTPKLLSEAMDSSQRVQRRTYGTRTVRLFPDLWLEVERPSWRGPARGFAMEDGAALCVFVMVGPNAPRVIRLEPDDAVFFIREG
ncbi:MAG: PilZ domain-containing protein [Myxococcales bacterium]|nr:PilZ domain-containing protein [Myxococcales bacterium]